MGRIQEAISSAVDAILHPGEDALAAATAPTPMPLAQSIMADRLGKEAFDEITIAEYFMGRDVAYAALLTPTLRDNAAETCRRWNVFLKAFYESTGINHRGVRSGWRPQAINERTPGAAPDSRHMTCEALDGEDPDKAMAAFAMANVELVSVIGLWFEDPFAKKPDGALYTPTWLHGQIVPPRSGRRFYLPF